jgi:cbb3-type cytochrome oxidase maturation protein
MLTVYYILVFGMIILFSGTVIWALWWAIRGGQMSDFQKGARSIFDADEPVGEPTDMIIGDPDAGDDPSQEDRSEQS